MMCIMIWQKPIQISDSPAKKTQNVDPWIPELHLDQNDKIGIESGGELVDKFMFAVNKIMKAQYNNINGFRDTLLVPSFDDDTKIWEYPQDKWFEPQRTQIHHTGKSHWVFSFCESHSKDKKQDIYLIDSFYHNQITPSMEIQLAKLYGRNKNSLSITTSCLQQQQLGPNCGLFAIAHMVEFCSGNYEGLEKNPLSRISMKVK